MIRSVFKILGLMAILLHFSPAWSLIVGPARIIGVVKSFDEKTVLIEGEKAKYDVPKEFVPEKNLKVGSKIEVLLSGEQLEKIKINEKKSQEKK